MNNDAARVAGSCNPRHAYLPCNNLRGYRPRKKGRRHKAVLLPVVGVLHVQALAD